MHGGAGLQWQMLKTWGQALTEGVAVGKNVNEEEQRSQDGALRDTNV